MSQRITRRRAMKDMALAGAGLWLADQASAQQDSSSPNEKLNVALVGSGGRGASNLTGLKSENIVALCDVDDRRAGLDGDGVDDPELCVLLDVAGGFGFVQIGDERGLGAGRCVLQRRDDAGTDRIRSWRAIGCCIQIGPVVQVDHDA